MVGWDLGYFSTKSSAIASFRVWLVRLVRLVVCSLLGPAMKLLRLIWRFKRAALHYVAPGGDPVSFS